MKYYDINIHANYKTWSGRGLTVVHCITQDALLSGLDIESDIWTFLGQKVHRIEATFDVLITKDNFEELFEDYDNIGQCVNDYIFIDFDRFNGRVLKKNFKTNNEFSAQRQQFIDQIKFELEMKNVLK